MAQGDGNPGLNKLAQALNAQMKRYHDDIKGELILDFGKILAGYKLKTNSFQKTIPKGDWMVCRWLTAYEKNTEIEYSPADHRHVHKFISPKLKVGDKVLVAWVQNEACVIDVIKSSKVL